MMVFSITKLHPVTHLTMDHCLINRRPQDALKRHDIGGARSAARAANAAFQDSGCEEGVAMAAALEQQADAMERLDKLALEASEAVQALRAALSTGRLEEARMQAKLAKELYAVEGLGEVGSKGLATLSGLERELGEAEMRAGLVQEGLEVIHDPTTPYFLVGLDLPDTF